ncbi:hypothetical protein AVEN_22838-1 [Araneus ventricosus]|uniref:Uncharacterized protein n=1 Tax=Araneus ventricosus TaxID=182803 RepID=A0A4Y2L9F7_ARAVE|nr:hypothetical protein AVEN_22838-1 [Araneus ventricosus]
MKTDCLLFNQDIIFVRQLAVFILWTRSWRMSCEKMNLRSLHQVGLNTLSSIRAIYFIASGTLSSCQAASSVGRNTSSKIRKPIVQGARVRITRVKFV